MKKIKKIYLVLSCTTFVLILCGIIGGAHMITAAFAFGTGKNYTISDFSNLATDWLKTISGSPADANNDGIVDIRDLGIMMSNWASSASSTATTPTCTSFAYSAWSACQNNTQTRTVASSIPSGCTGGNSVLQQTCQSGSGTPIQNAQVLTLSGGFVGFSYPGITFNAGEKKYYQFTVPANAKYVEPSIASYDQSYPINMVLEKGDAVDYFDTTYQHYVSTGWGTPYSATINSTQVWANMVNDQYGQNLVVSSPAAGTYYLIVKNSGPAPNHLNVQVLVAN